MSMPPIIAKISISIQSFSDVITNSSSEIFCQIEANDAHGIQVIAEYLNSILPYKVTPSMVYDNKTDEEYEGNTIDFWAELGSLDDTPFPEQFAALLNEVLLEHFNEGSFKINLDVPY